MKLRFAKWFTRTANAAQRAVWRWAEAEALAAPLEALELSQEDRAGLGWELVEETMTATPDQLRPPTVLEAITITVSAWVGLKVFTIWAIALTP